VRINILLILQLQLFTFVLCCVKMNKAIIFSHF